MEKKSFATAVLGRIRAKHVGRIHGIENLPAKGPFLIAHNHGSFMDPILIAALCYPHLAGRSLYFISQIYSMWSFLIRLLFKGRIRTLPIDLEDKGRVIERAAGCLTRGDIVAIAPEGPITSQDGPRKGKTGAARLALRTGLPVIPVCIRIDRCLWHVLHVLRWFFRPKHRAEVVFGKALCFGGPSKIPPSRHLLDDVTRDIMNEIMELCGKDYHETLP